MHHDTAGRVLKLSGLPGLTDNLPLQVLVLEARPAGSKEAVKLSELLTQKLLVLDSMHVTAETRQLRKGQINRINALW